MNKAIKESYLSTLVEWSTISFMRGRRGALLHDILIDGLKWNVKFLYVV